MDSISIKRINHRNEDRLFLIFDYDLSKISKVKKIKDSRWSATHNSWHIPNKRESLAEFSVLFPETDISAQLSTFSVNHVNQVKQQVNSSTKPGLVKIEYNFEKIKVYMPFHPDDISFMKDIFYCKWNDTAKHWVLPNSEDNLSLLHLHFGKRISSIKEIPNDSKRSSEFYPVIEIPATVRAHTSKLRQWMEHKRYSPSSIKGYIEAANTFLSYTYPKPIEELNNDDMIDFVNGYIIKRNLSYAYQNQVINATKLLFSQVFDSKIDIEKLDRPRREHKLPNVLSKQEIRLILASVQNTKHSAILSLIYACGLRRSEVLNLRPKDVDSNRNLLIIRKSKGKKDRIIPISIKTIEMLREYYLEYKPKLWLFEGQQPGEQYSATSLQKILKQSVKKSKINKPVTLHWLRHSYATHLLEAGVDLRFIQEILGHNSSRTTEIYTHVSTKNLQNIKSPFDDL